MIKNIFIEAYNSPYSVIILDSFENLIEYSPIGNYYSNKVLQALYALIRKPHPKNNKLIIISTSNSDLCRELFNLDDLFDKTIEC